MAYKPYKPNKGYKYTNVGDKDNSKYDIARMKLFGFRSGIAWKMIPALLYYVFAILFIGSSFIGEFREFTFEDADVVLCVLKYIFIIIIALGPAIFFSDFSYRDKLPLFKRRNIIGNTIGSIIVFIFSVFMIWTYQYCMSDTYKESANAYYEEKESIQQNIMKGADSLENVAGEW